MYDLENRMVIDSEWDEEEYGIKRESDYDNEERWFWGTEEE